MNSSAIQICRTEILKVHIGLNVNVFVPEFYAYDVRLYVSYNREDRIIAK